MRRSGTLSGHRPLSLGGEEINTVINRDTGRNKLLTTFEEDSEAAESQDSDNISVMLESSKCVG